MSFFNRFKSKPDHSYQNQLKYEREGATFAAHTTVRSVQQFQALREFCPYPVDSFEWNHWVYGCETAAAPHYVYADGSQIWLSTSSDSQIPDDYCLKWPDGTITNKNGGAP